MLKMEPMWSASAKFAAKGRPSQSRWFGLLQSKEWMRRRRLRKNQEDVKYCWLKYNAKDKIEVKGCNLSQLKNKCHNKDCKTPTPLLQTFSNNPNQRSQKKRKCCVVVALLVEHVVGEWWCTCGGGGWVRSHQLRWLLSTSLAQECPIAMLVLHPNQHRGIAGPYQDQRNIAHIVIQTDLAQMRPRHLIQGRIFSRSTPGVQLCNTPQNSGESRIQVPHKPTSCLSPRPTNPNPP